MDRPSRLEPGRKIHRLSAGSNADCRCGADRRPRSQGARTTGGTDRRPLPRVPNSGHHEVASDRGGERAAAIYSLIATAKLNGVDPQAWLADVLRRIADYPASR